MSTQVQAVDVEKSYENSVGIKECYLRGKRTKFLFPENLYNHPFWIVREGIKNKQIPEIPESLKGLPEDDCLLDDLLK